MLTLNRAKLGGKGGGGVDEWELFGGDGGVVSVR